MKAIYDVSVQFAGEEPIVARVEEDQLPATITEADIAEKYLERLEATLEKVATGRHGTLRVGSRVIPVSDTRVPEISVRFNTVIYTPEEQAARAEQET